ncbi:MAG: diguanylate cyclase [Candidatus Omnitrophota bacterium]
MKNKNNLLSLSSQGLKYKLKISFYLMAVLPLLVSVYLASQYIFPRFGLRLDIVLSLSISAFIAIVGFLVIKEVFDRIVSVTAEAKLIAAGDVNRRLEGIQAAPDEVGDLGDALNQMTQRIRSNMNELKNYGEKTTEINMEIQKRVIVLSSLLQVSSLITQGASLEDIFKVIAEKSRLLANSETGYLLFREEGQENFSMRSVSGTHAGLLSTLIVEPNGYLFSKTIQVNKPLIIDAENQQDKNLTSAFQEKFRMKNTLALPVQLAGRVMAILGIGTASESRTYRKEDIELLDIFAKQIAIAVENDLLSHKVERLEIRDALTGLYNDIFIRSRLQEEIKRAIAYQRPCAFIVLDIDNFKEYYKQFGSLQSEGALKKIAFLIRSSISEIDRAARTGDDEFAIVLPEKNKRQAKDVAEEIRKKIEFSTSEEEDIKKRFTVSAGVSENPLDGVESEELINKARELLHKAKALGKNCVSV